MAKPNWGYTKRTDYESGYAILDGHTLPEEWTDYTIEYYKYGSKTPYESITHCYLPAGMKPKFRTEVDAIARKWDICREFAKALYNGIFSPRGKTVIRYSSNGRIVAKAGKDQYGNTVIKWEK